MPALIAVPLVDLNVTQSNRLIESAHTLSLNEKRLLIAAISQIDPRKPAPATGLAFEVHAAQFAEVFGIDEKHAYEALFDATRRLYNRDVGVYVKSGKVREHFRWVYHVKYHEGEGRVSLAFSPTLAPYLTDMQREFTTYQLRQVGKLKSFYAMRLYELLVQFRKTGERTIDIARFRDTMDLRDKYTDVKNLRVRVIEPAIADINAQTNLVVAWQVKRIGRKVVGLSFIIEETPQEKLPL